MILKDAPKRTEYLKSGCKECKRRKIKCDEFLNPPIEARLVINNQNKRLCWQCTRLKKICEYPMKGEKVLRVSKKKQQESNNSQSSSADITPLLSLIGSGDPESARERSLDSSSHHPIQNPSTHLHLLLNKPAHCQLHFLNQPSTFPLGDLSSSASLFHSLQKGPVYSHLHRRNSSPDHNSPPGLREQSDEEAFLNLQGSADLAVLAFDLNNLVNDMMQGTTKGERHDINSMSFGSNLASPNMDGEFHQCRSHFEAWTNGIPRNIGLDIFNLSFEAQIYLKEFYDEFSYVIMPFTAFDRMSQSHSNPLRDILLYHASSEPFLLAAVLAQGASSRFLQSKNIVDDQAYHKYLLKCLKLLSAALGKTSNRKSASLLGNIEPVLLAVLLLTSSNAANTNQHWRPHLQGAKGILLRHSNSQKHMTASTTILLCKYWFVSIEILAALGLKLGGTIHLEEEIELLLHFEGNEVKLLETMGLVLSNGFFLIGGYHVDLLPALKGLIKQLNKYRKNKNHIFNETSEYIRLLADFDRFRLLQFVHRKAFLPSGDFAGSYLPSGYLLDRITVDGTQHVLSWMDTSHQMYCLAGIVTVMTEFLEISHTSPQVETISKELILFASVLSQFSESPLLIKCSVMMVQWPMTVAGFNLTLPEDQQNVLKFFEVARSVGAGSADHSIARLKSFWRKGGSMLAFDDNVDAMTY